MLGGNVVNLFADDSLRWIFLHFDQLLLPEHFACCVFCLMALGIVHESGIFSVKLLSRKAIAYWAIYLLVLFFMLRWPVLFGYSALLGITGSEVPSPWFSFSPFLICITLIIVSLIYAVRVRLIRSFAETFDLVIDGFRRYTPWLLVMMLGNLIYQIIVFAV